MTDKRIVRETRTRTLIRSRLGSGVTWIFAIILTYFITDKWEYVLELNVPIAIFAVGWSFYY